MIAQLSCPNFRPSGCGKSTVLSLIGRFYDPQIISGGKIKIDGLDLRMLDLKGHRQRVGLVTQEPILFSGTIFDNINYGNPYNNNPEEDESCAFDRVIYGECICTHYHLLVYSLVPGQRKKNIHYFGVSKENMVIMNLYRFDSFVVIM